MARLYSISGLGFAIAKTIGSLAIPNNISGVKIFPADKPKKMSAPFNASPKVIPGFPFEYFCCNKDKSVLSEDKTPSLSNMMILSGLIPKSTYKLAHANAADPAPETTNFVFSTCFPASSSAFKSAAEEIIAVPC